jgi:tripartite-type tricarboxylate transporter receptor subunit TctC
MKRDKMNKLMTRVFLCLTLSVCQGTFAQTFPDQPVKIVVGFAAGSSIDIITRVVAQKLGEKIGKPVTVENKPGAGANIGAEYVARSNPNGYTLLAANNGLAIAPAIYKNMTFNPSKDLVAITQMTSMPHVVVAPMDLPANNIPELIALAKARPGKLNMSSAGTGNADHLAGELMFSMANINIVHVPYKGGAQAMMDVANGNVAIFFSGLPGALPMIKAGKVKALGVGTAQRSWALPEVQSIGETLPGFDVTLWYGLLAPAGTPKTIVDYFAREVKAIMTQTDLIESLRNVGADPVGSTPQQFQALFDKEVQTWQAVVKNANIVVD